MEIIKTFNFNNQSLSVYGTIEKPLFRGRDVAIMLGYARPEDAVRAHVFDEDKCTTVKHGGGFRTLINESGMYALIFGSKLEQARDFKHWITSEVLPSIRKNGQYELRPKYIRKNHELYITNEASLQKEIIDFLRKYEKKYHLKITTPLGELQDTSEKRIESYKMGYRRGQPDIIINNHSKHHCGLVIELKTPKGNGELKPSQIEVIKAYKDDGYKCIVSNDLCDIIKKLTLWFGNLRLKCKYCAHKFKTNESRRIHYKYFHRMP